MFMISVASDVTIYWLMPLVILLIVWFAARRYSRSTKNHRVLFVVPSLSIIVTTISVVVLGWILYHVLISRWVPLQSLAEILYFTLAFGIIPIQVIGGHVLVNISIPSKLKTKSKGGMLSLIFGVIWVYIGILPAMGYIGLLVFAPIAVILGIISWGKGDSYGLTGLVLGMILILFWIILGKAFWAGW
jgi:hypothetical protein